MTTFNELENLAKRATDVSVAVLENIDSAEKKFQSDVNSQSMTALGAIYPFVVKAMDNVDDFTRLCEKRGVSHEARDGADKFTSYVRAVCGEFVTEEKNGATTTKYKPKSGGTISRWAKVCHIAHDIGVDADEIEELFEGKLEADSGLIALLPDGVDKTSFINKDASFNNVLSIARAVHTQEPDSTLFSDEEWDLMTERQGGEPEFTEGLRVTLQVEKINQDGAVVSTVKTVANESARPQIRQITKELWKPEPTPLSPIQFILEFRDVVMACGDGAAGMLAKFQFSSESVKCTAGGATALPTFNGEGPAIEGIEGIFYLDVGMLSGLKTVKQALKGADVTFVMGENSPEIVFTATEPSNIEKFVKAFNDARSRSAKQYSLPAWVEQESNTVAKVSMLTPGELEAEKWFTAKASIDEVVSFKVSETDLKQLASIMKVEAFKKQAVAEVEVSQHGLKVNSVNSLGSFAAINAETVSYDGDTIKLDVVRAEVMKAATKFAAKGKDGCRIGISASGLYLAANGKVSSYTGILPKYVNSRYVDTDLTEQAIA